MDHWSFDFMQEMNELNAQQQCFNYDFHESEHERGCYETNFMPMTAQNMDYSMGNVVCEQDSYSQAQTEGLHEDNFELKELLAQFLEDIKVDRDNSQVSCNNMEESCIEEVVEQNEDNFKELLAHSIDYMKMYHDNFEASCKNIEAHINTIMEHLKEESCVEEVVELEEKSCIEDMVEQKEEKSVECELECGHLEMVEEKEKNSVVVEKQKFKNSDKKENPRLRYEKSHVTIEIQPLVSEEKNPPQNELQFFQERKNSYPKCLLVGAWEHLLPYAKYMGFLTKKRKRKDDIFFLSYYPP